MPRTSIVGSSTTPKVDVVIDMGNPFLNLTVDGFLKIGSVAATRAATEDAYHIVRKGTISTHNFENTEAKVKTKHLERIRVGLRDVGDSESLTWGLTTGTFLSFGDNTIKLKKMCKEGAYWGTVAGAYVGMEYGVERIRGTRDWKNAMIGGALTGALVSAASNNNRDKVVIDAITGGAVATAAEFINSLT